jgi:hypothetical protein
VDKTRDFCEEFLRRLTIEAYYSKGYPRGLADMTSHLNGSILTEVQTEFEKAPAWLVFRKALLQLADDQVGKSDAAESSVSSQAQSLTGDAESGEASQHSDGLVQADQATAIVESTAITKQELLEQLRNLAPEDRLVHAQAFHYAKVKNGGTFTGDAFLINEATQKRLLAFRSLSDDDRADVLREIPFSEPIDRESVNKRRTVVEPILNRRGLSIQDWAKNSKVDFHTANDYLKGITSPYPSTRKKLAESIGINADDLPK